MKYGVIGFLIGAGIVWLVSMNAVNTNNASMMNMMGLNLQQQTSTEKESEDDDRNINMHGEMGMGSSMDDMMGSLNDKKGEEFDIAFIEAMIPHHQGAIDMAQAALTNAEHQEIKDLAVGIIDAQQKEINMMNEWLKMWKQ